MADMNIILLEEHGYESALKGLALSYYREGIDFNEWYTLDRRTKAIKQLQNLAFKGGGHNKAIASIFTWWLVRAPRGWYQEYDTYKVATTANSSCYDNNTEVLTRDGWKYFRDISKEDLFWSMDITTRQVVYDKATNLIETEYSGDMYSLQSSRFNLLVTPNHNMLIANRVDEEDNLRFIEAKDFRCHNHIPKTFIDNTGIEEAIFTLPYHKSEWDTGYSVHTREYPQVDIPMDIWLKFLGFYISQGNYNKADRNYNVQVTHNTVDGSAELFEEVLNKLPFKWYKLYEESKHTYRYTISNKQLYMYCYQLGKSLDKHLPREFLNLSTRQSSILLEWLMRGDGTKNKKNSNGWGGYTCYSTISTQLANNIQELILKVTGTCCNINNYRKGNRDNTLYIITPQKTKYSRINKDNINIQQYTGKIYCVEVPNHTLLVRREGKTTICGNSTMHTLSKELLTREHFAEGTSQTIIDNLNELINSGADITTIKMNLPESYLQTREICINYMTIQNIIKQRTGHRLKMWDMFIDSLLSQVHHPELLRQFSA